MSNETEQRKAKPGRKPAVDYSVAILQMQEQILNLQYCISKMAHYSGANRVLDEFEIPRWEPSKKDMTKYKG